MTYITSVIIQKHSFDFRLKTLYLNCELLLLKSFHLISFAKLKIQRVGEIFESLYQLLGCAFNRVFHSCIASFPLILIYLFIYFNILFFFRNIDVYVLFIFFYFLFFIFDIRFHESFVPYNIIFMREQNVFASTRTYIYSVAHFSK